MSIIHNLGDFDIEELIGTGTFGSVYKGKEKATNKIVALKKIKQISKDEGFPLNSIREIRINRLVHHKNIVELLNVLSDKETHNVYLIFEYCQYTLSDFIYHKSDVTIDMKKHAQYIFKQIVDGLAEIHKNNIIHRDIKPSNIMITNEGVVKIGDFGISRMNDGRPLSKNVAALPYRAPECYSNQYSKEMDIWALGCVLYELMTGHFLFDPKTSDMEMAKEIATQCHVDINQIITPEGYSQVPHGSIDKINSPECASCKDLLEKMLSVNKNERITIEGILEHPYYKEAVEAPFF